MNPPLPHPVFTSRKDRAFTLVELLTVIAIIGILAAIIIPTVSKVRKTAQRATCVSNIRNLHGLAMLYASDNRDVLPLPADTNTITPPIPQADRNAWFWRRAFLPYVYKGINVSTLEPRLLYRMSGATCPVVRKQVKTSHPDYDDAVISFGMNVHLNNGSAQRLQVSRVENPSRTMLFTESRINQNGNPEASMTMTYAENMAENAPNYSGDYHDGSQNICYVDGHVENFKIIKRISQEPYKKDSAQDIWSPFSGSN
ncbi:prepilin-type N-terminal cleavage/methylation domain-containing protein [Opitutaceae bacterium TAV1]|nr:prepilin-type N-terminal cleavage/methylation domain-containing protein [Opitutaceae bacterium TAV1]